MEMKFIINLLFLCNPYHQLSAIENIVSYSLMLFIVEYIFLKQFVIIDGKIYLLINRLDRVVKAVVPSSNTNEWFDGEIADIHMHDKLYKRLKLTKLHNDKEKSIK